MIPVDLYGLPADVKAIRDVVGDDVIIIEDAAQAHGATYRGEPLGSFSDMVCWSFYATKNMTTGEGGMVTTNNDEYAERLRYIRSHGGGGERISFMIGHNYRMPEIEAAIGYVQLQKLPKLVERRRENAKLLSEKLNGAKGLQLPIEPPECRHAWYLYTIRLINASVEIRDKIVEGLRRRGIGATVYYRTPIHLMPYYRQFVRHNLPETEKATQEVFSLPVHPGVTGKEIEYIGDSVLKELKQHTR